MLSIRVENISLTPIIGVYETERVNPQELKLDLALGFIQPGDTDDIKTTLDYSIIVPNLVTHVNGTSYHLIETLADEILNYCLGHSLVEKVSSKLYKPSALKNGLVSFSTTKIKYKS